ncbi:MAG: Type 4 prepilin-like proteins leader peptide-processing enzyme [Firmicutes bacterium ADurb.Bin419]|mgnify:CR=1 FL=1|nr:MAG: Type 4 prepilin-like proteins leader peptide-processing enzyme [Firmicutes bacterium ADurb.Bin419]
MEIILLIYVAVVGVVIGSFLNVCIYRIPKVESIAYPPSHCGSCGKRLKAVDLVPIFSWLFLKGKCRYCRSKISPRYAMVEALTGLTFLLLFNKYGVSVDFLASAFLMSILIAVFFIDIDHRIIPDELVVTGLVAGALVFIYNALFPMKIMGGGQWWEPLLGMFVGSVTLMVVGLIGMLIYKTDDAMGGGDIKIFAPIGIFLGWKMTFVALLISIVLAGLISLVLVIIRVKDRKSTIPFGPFIVMGTLITYLYGWDILKWYINILLY